MKSATAALPLFIPSSSLTKPILLLSYQNPNLALHFRRLIISTRYRRRDSISGDEENDDEDFGRHRRRWWSNKSTSDMDQGPGILEELIDGVWIFKVFGSYTPLLPVFLFSMLLATGPKAFLVSLAVPIGQSAFTLAFKKLWGKKQNNPRGKTNFKKKARVITASNVEFEDEEKKAAREGSQKGKTGYRSWIGRDDVPVKEDNQNPSTFGGWDDWDRATEFDMKYSRSANKGKFIRRERKSETPLLLRLLIAVFPFLRSWTDIL